MSPKEYRKAVRSHDYQPLILVSSEMSLAYRFLQFTESIAGFFYSMNDFRIQRTISSMSTSKVDKYINKLKPLTLNKIVWFDIGLT